MKRITLSILIALSTFAVGISASTALLTPPVRRISQPNEPGRTSVTSNPENAGGDQSTLEMVFVLDTTGSMGGLIDGAKQRIWGIINEVMQTPSHPAVRVGLVAYRDRGDAYVTQVLPLTDDLDKVYATLMEYRADGGGDGPEDVRRALADGVRKAGWSQGPASRVAQVLFLVGDAPPHEDYVDEPGTLDTAAEAVRSGMVINTIQCGNQSDTRETWQQIARRGEGQYFAIAQNGGVETISSPFDARLSELGTKLGQTFMAYGGGSGVEGASFRRELKAKQDTFEMSVAATAPASAQADRAMNKVLNERAYAGDLLQSVENKSVKLESVKDEDLPDDVRKLAPAARKGEIDRRLEERRKLRAEIVSLSKQRDGFLAAERKKRAGTKGTQQGFDTAVAAALKEQMARKGIR